MGFGPPPAQIPACAANALSSCLGFERRIALRARGEECGEMVTQERHELLRVAEPLDITYFSHETDGDQHADGVPQQSWGVSRFG